MIRKFNYTGRKRIDRERLKIKLVAAEGDFPSFDAAINLDDLGLPSDAAVYVEAYDRSSYMRFDFGTVAQQIAPARRQLTELQSRELILFRVRVVDKAGAHGRVLAVADRLTPVATGAAAVEREGLLGVELQDLGDRIWGP